jgi:hypothetical protein
MLQPLINVKMLDQNPLNSDLWAKKAQLIVANLNNTAINVSKSSQVKSMSVYSTRFRKFNLEGGGWVGGRGVENTRIAYIITSGVCIYFTHTHQEHTHTHTHTHAHKQTNIMKPVYQVDRYGGC